jgi:putative ATPase
VRRIAAAARERLEREGRRTVLFLDEVHRFNRAQQDAILPYLEDGTLIFLGATTENPSFSLTGPLLSRCRVYRLEPLTADEVKAIVLRALSDRDRGLGKLGLQLPPEALEYLVQQSGGDARTALTALEMAAEVATADGSRIIGRELLAQIFQRRLLKEGSSAEAHYNMASALIKSIRSSDPDAAIYWLARILEAEQDPLFVARRLVISAAEDVGLADPQALVVAVAAQQAALFVGMPEAFLPLSQAALYLSLAPKSNSALRAYAAARSLIEDKGELQVPLFLRNAPTGLMRTLGYGKGYRYAHEEAEEAEKARLEGRPFQNCLPEEISDHQLYRPGAHGWEARQPWFAYRSRSHE